MDVGAATVFHKGYCSNDQILARLVGFMRLAEYMTKAKLIPAFIHFIWYDNAPSHWKRAADSLHVDSTRFMLKLRKLLTLSFYSMLKLRKLRKLRPF